MISTNKIFHVRCKTRKPHRISNIVHRTLLLLAITIVSGVFLLANTGCGIYRFRDVSIPDTIHTVKVNFIENKATYINPTLSPRLTDRLRQKITSQTRLSQTNNTDNADWVISGTINNYSFTTSGISQQRESTNRLTVGVHISILDQKANKTKEYDVSRSFEFSASQSIQQAEASLGDEILRGLTDDMFNRIFSDW